MVFGSILSLQGSAGGSAPIACVSCGIGHDVQEQPLRARGPTDAGAPWAHAAALATGKLTHAASLVRAEVGGQDRNPALSLLSGPFRQSRRQSSYAIGIAWGRRRR